MSGCSCDSIRENSNGQSYSLSMLGVQCGYCEAEAAEYEYEYWWESLTPGEQVRERWLNACSRVKYMRRPGAPSPWGDSPF